MEHDDMSKQEWVMVPREPTREMVANAMKECGGIGAGSCGEHVGVDWDDMRAVFAAMLAAAPSQPAPTAEPTYETLRKALQFYADKCHFGISEESAWDTVSGEPRNFWCDEAGTATVEDGTVAAMALNGTPLPDDDETPQPLPDAAPSMSLTDIARTWRRPWAQTDSALWTERNVVNHEEALRRIYSAACIADARRIVVSVLGEQIISRQEQPLPDAAPVPTRQFESVWASAESMPPRLSTRTQPAEPKPCTDERMCSGCFAGTGCTNPASQGAQPAEAQAGERYAFVLAQCHEAQDIAASRGWALNAIATASTTDPKARKIATEALLGAQPVREAAEPVADPLAIALNTMHKDCHKAADAFWTYWNENGETHKHGYYESTWGAINRALRTVGVVPWRAATGEKGA